MQPPIETRSLSLDVTRLLTPSTNAGITGRPITSTGYRNQHRYSRSESVQPDSLRPVEPITNIRQSNHRAGSGPTYLALGRMILLLAACSSRCAAQPTTRLVVNVGVNMV